MILFSHRVKFILNSSPKQSEKLLKLTRIWVFWIRVAILVASLHSTCDPRANAVPRLIYLAREGDLVGVAPREILVPDVREVAEGVIVHLHATHNPLLDVLIQVAIHWIDCHFNFLWKLHLKRTYYSLSVSKNIIEELRKFCILNIAILIVFLIVVSSIWIQCPLTFPEFLYHPFRGCPS